MRVSRRFQTFDQGNVPASILPFPDSQIRNKHLTGKRTSVKNHREKGNWIDEKKLQGERKLGFPRPEPPQNLFLSSSLPPSPLPSSSVSGHRRNPFAFGKHSKLVSNIKACYWRLFRKEGNEVKRGGCGFKVFSIEGEILNFLLGEPVHRLSPFTMLTASLDLLTRARPLEN